MENENNHYIVLAAAGHCGNAKFRPVLHWVNEKSKIDANKLVRNYPRVKRDQKFAILATYECTYHEGLLVKIINDEDPFLTQNDNSENEFKSVQKRENVDRFVELYRKTRDSKYLDFVMTKKDYPDEEQILQRFCTPIRVRNQIIYEKNSDLHSMLEEYFTYNVKKYALSPMSKLDKDVIETETRNKTFTTSQTEQYENIMRKKTNRTRMLILYAGLFGENNPLGIDFDGKTISFINSSGEKEEINIPQGEITDNDNKYDFKVKKLLTTTGEIKPIYAKQREITY